MEHENSTLETVIQQVVAMKEAGDNKIMELESQLNTCNAAHLILQQECMAKDAHILCMQDQILKLMEKINRLEQGYYSFQEEVTHLAGSKRQKTAIVAK